MGQVFFKKGQDLIKGKPQNFFDIIVKDIDGKDFPMSQLKEKKCILVTNVACKCGFTNTSYQQFVQLYSKYKDQGLEILAFPSNQFLSQEPWDSEKIKEFVTSKYGVTFPLFSKVEVNGPNPHPIYQFLRTKSELHNPKNGYSKQIPWNFTKFLVNNKGEVYRFYGPTITPFEIENVITEMLQSSK